MEKRESLEIPGGLFHAFIANLIRLRRCGFRRSHAGRFRGRLGQGADSGLQLEEVTVTARKVEENLMEVPLAITAFSDKTIEEQGIKQLTDVMRFTPSFNFANQQGGSGRNDRSANALVFRGLFLGNNVGTTPAASCSSTAPPCSARSRRRSPTSRASRC